MKTLKTILILSMLFNLNVFYQFNKVVEAERNYQIQSGIAIHNMILLDIQLGKVEYVLKNYADDYDTAYRIAKCESNLGKYRDNFEGSGATGLFQFKPKTWNNYCEGNINNDIAQTKCFNKLYSKYPHWWECK